MKKRFALIIGAASCGTTALFRQLAAHPQVAPCRVKEPRFFTDDRKWALGVDWYRSLWDFHEPDERVAVEASTDYTKHPAVSCPAGRIARTPAGFRFLYILRNPLDRIESQHSRAVAEGWTQPGLAEGTLEHYIDVSRYAMQLELYRQHFPADDFLLLRFEDLAADPLRLMGRVCRFLEIDPYFGFPELQKVHRREAGAVRGRRAARSWIAKLPGLSRLIRPPPAPRVERRFRLRPEQREWVLRELRDDLAQLEAQHGFDVSRWRLES